jgi:hypothetical protein
MSPSPKLRLSLAAAVSALLVATPCAAKRDMIEFEDVDEVLVTVSGGSSQAFRRDNVDKICRVALEKALEEDEEFRVVTSRQGADAEIELTGSTLTITEGPADAIGRVILNYLVTVRDREYGRELFSHINSMRGDTAAEVCTLMAEEVTAAITEAKDD